MAFIIWLVIGLIAGAAARLLVPGRDPMGWIGTLVLGLVGSFVGGLLSVALTDRTMDEFSTAGFLGSVAGAIVALLIYRFMQPRGRLSGRPGARI